MVRLSFSLILKATHPRFPTSCPTSINPIFQITHFFYIHASRRADVGCTEAQSCCHLESFNACCTSSIFIAHKKCILLQPKFRLRSTDDRKTLFLILELRNIPQSCLLGSDWKPWGRSRWRFYWPFQDSWLSFAWMHANHWKVGQWEFVQRISLSSSIRSSACRGGVV